ncbi:MAG: hypothetical protein AB2L20_14930 [Mangrovibacterium sp.]
MEIKDYIELAGVLIGVALAIIKMWTSFQLKFKALETEVLQIKKDINEIRKDHDDDITQLRLGFSKDLDRLHNENREDHGKMFGKIEEMQKLLVRVDTAFASHMKESSKN